MNEDQTLQAGERTQDTEQTNNDPQYPGLECGGLLFNGKTADEWFDLHEEIRQDYGRAIKELEAQDLAIRKHEEPAEQARNEMNTSIPGLKAKHAIITPECRQNRGDDCAMEEALDRVRSEYIGILDMRRDKPTFHVVLTVQ